MGENRVKSKYQKIRGYILIASDNTVVSRGDM